MKIAQIATPGGRVAGYLADELARLGHDVTSFAAGDGAAAVRPHAHRFDVLHFHGGGDAIAAFRDLAHKALVTPDGLANVPDGGMPLVSSSDAQRAAAPRANWIATVYPGLPEEICPLNPAAPRGTARYVAFLGCAVPDSGLERAIDIALRARVRLRISAKVQPGESARYWRDSIAPRLKDAPDLLQDAGEVDEAAKPAFLGHAAALLFSADLPEPFGLAMIEAMSCGTPVIAWPRGAVPEVVEHGVTGFLVDSVGAAAHAIDDVPRLDRTRVRARFDQRFSAQRMARDYLSAYRALGRTRLRAVQA